MDVVVNTNSETPESIQAEKSATQVVKSQFIAEQLCSNFPYFKDLVAVRKDKFKENRRVWIFRRSEQFDKDFALLVDECKKRHEEREIVNG